MSEATYHECVKYKVTIDNLSPHSKIVWLKGSTIIDLNNPRYKASTYDGDNAVLQIDKVTKSDEDIYTVKVYNSVGKEESCSSKKLKVIGGKTLIIYTCKNLLIVIFETVRQSIDTFQ